MIKFQEKKVVSVQDWDDLVKETYGRPYSFQQQNGCQERGMFDLTVPSTWTEDFEKTTVPDEVNGDEKGVSFAAWLARDPTAWYGAPEDKRPWTLELFWDRNFYPDVYTLANDLHAKGLLPAGDYVIDIDW